jgi:hypothetical protein
MYQPQSVVIHHESMSRPAERRLQLVEANRAKFVEKWGEELKKRQPPLPGEKAIEVKARDLRQGRRILLIAECEDGAEFSRLAKMIEHLVAGNCVVTLVVPPQVLIEATIHEWQARGVEVLYPPWVDFVQILKGNGVLAERKNCYDAIIVHSSSDVSAIPASAKKWNPRALTIYDALNCESEQQLDWLNQFDGVIARSETQREDIIHRHQIKHLRVWNEAQKDSIVELLTPSAWDADYFMRRAHVAEQNAEEYRASHQELEKIRGSKAWRLLGVYWEILARIQKLLGRSNR